VRLPPSVLAYLTSSGRRVWISVIVTVSFTALINHQFYCRILDLLRIWLAIAVVASFIILKLLRIWLPVIVVAGFLKRRNSIIKLLGNFIDPLLILRLSLRDSLVINPVGFVLWSY
jgi:hypothetical protein